MRCNALTMCIEHSDYIHDLCIEHIRVYIILPVYIIVVGGILASRSQCCAEVSICFHSEILHVSPNELCVEAYDLSNFEQSN